MVDFKKGFKHCLVDYKPQVKPPFYYEDVFPAERNIEDPHLFRIGDCQLSVAPERIQVKHKISTSVNSALRQKSSMKTKSGYKVTEISIPIFFHSVEDINGYVVIGPEGRAYYMDGLRALIAQFKKTPFLPIQNEFLNAVHDIHTVTLSSMTISTVPEFPNCLEATLNMYAFNHTPYTNNPSWALDQMFCWPLQRWFYQKDMLSKYRLIPETGMNDSLNLLVTKPTNKPKTLQMDAQGNYDWVGAEEEELTPEELSIWNELANYTLSDETSITSIMVNFSNITQQLQVQAQDSPTSQFLGSMDTEIMIAMETQSREDIAYLNELINFSSYLAREYRDRKVSGSLQVINDIINCMGVTHAMPLAFDVTTIDESPGLFSVNLIMIDFDPNQDEQESLTGYRGPRGSVGELGFDDLLSVSSKSINFMQHEVVVEELLDSAELYPDLELPTYLEANQEITRINEYRERFGLSKIGITELKKPSHSRAVFVDPDFYIFYPMLDGLESIISDISDELYEMHKGVENILNEQNLASFDMRGAPTNIKTFLMGKSEFYDTELVTQELPPEVTRDPDDVTIIYEESRQSYEYYKPTKRQPPPEELLEDMTFDMRFYSKRSTMLRAFPSFVFLFMNEGEWLDGRKLWTNYYAYHSAVEISIHSTREHPVHTAAITLTNTYGNLSTRNKLHFPDHNIFQLMADRILPKVRQEMIDRQSFFLEHAEIFAGTRVHVRLGYGSAASSYPVVFNGLIAEMHPGDLTEIICQSDGIEIIDQITEWGETATNTMFQFGNEPKNILDVLFRRRTTSAFTSHFGESSRYGVEHFGTVLHKADGVIGFFGAVLPLFTNEKGYDVTKNIYPAHSIDGNKKPITHYMPWFDGEKNLQIWLYGKSIWDISQILALASPGYIATPLYHGFHSTFFYGKPHWTHKYKYIRTKDGDWDNDKISNYEEAGKPVQQIHIIDSMMDIVGNGLYATSRNLTTVTRGVYTMGNNMELSRTIYADRAIRPEMQRTRLIETETLQDFKWVPGFIENILANLQFRPGHAVAGRIAASALHEAFKTMYDGQIVILGDPAIKPHDLIALCDMHEEMFGNVGVREVVHELSLESGFITSITPDLCVAHTGDHETLRLFGTVAAQAVLGALTWAAVIWQASKVKIAGEVLTFALIKTKIATSGVGAAWLGAGTQIAKLGKEIVNLVGTKVAASQIQITGGPVIWLKKGIGWFSAKGTGSAMTAATQGAAPGLLAKAGAGIFGIGAKGAGILFGLLTNPAVIVGLIIANYVGKFLNNFLDAWGEDNAINIFPVNLKGSVFVAGIVGHKRLIPGYTDPNQPQYEWPDNPYEDGLVPRVRATDPVSVQYNPLRAGDNRDYLTNPVSGGSPNLMFKSNGSNGGMITSHFSRTPVRSRGGYPHLGIDLIPSGKKGQARVGHPILACADGKVTSVNNNARTSTGKSITILHNNGMESVYYHLNNIHVRQGQVVEAGQQIGGMGWTGWNTTKNESTVYPPDANGTHLHFGVKINGSWVDPEPYLTIALTYE